MGIKLCPLFPTCGLICLICCPYCHVFFPMGTFKLTVVLSCCLTLFFKPRGQMFCPSVRVPLDFNWDYLNDPCVECLCYQVVFYLLSSQFIIMAILLCDFIEFNCKTGPIAIFFPFANAVHVKFGIIIPYPHIALLLHCRGSQLRTVQEWI